MHRKILPAIAGAALISVAAMPANAADIIYDPPVYKYEPPEPVSYGGWYLRGHIGLTNQRYRGLDSAEIRNAINTPAMEYRWLDRGSFSSSGLIGGGVGYQLNHWLRGDVSFEYRMPSKFTALDTFINQGSGQVNVNDYRARKSELLFLANAYADLGKYHGITPYVGAGIGASRNTISGFVDHNPQTGVSLSGATHSQWQFAWALHAGIGVELNDRATLDVGYSFTHLGNGRTGAITSNDMQTYQPFTFRDLHSHDLKVGLRYSLH
jgi:opacity protein-like surface antigen